MLLNLPQNVYSSKVKSMAINEFFSMQNLKQLKRKLRSTIMKSLREGVAAARIADFLNDQLKSIGIKNEPAGAIICVHSGTQYSVSGCGKIFDQFIRTANLTKFTGSNDKPATFYEANFETAPIRLVKFDETFHKMPYDVRKSEFAVNFYACLFVLMTSR